MPEIPRLGFDLVDVREIARLHILAMMKPSAAGQRFIGAGEFLWGEEIASILKKRLAEKARKVPSMVVPDFLVRVFALFDPAVRSQLFNLGKFHPTKLVKCSAGRPVQHQKASSTPLKVFKQMAWYRRRTPDAGPAR